ncbi:MAG: PglZ domain protein [Candidatus Magnetoglobus multicellularis str. Araruama]|uniref:PglZ domain protein n=1 Tax=Candidatus Magnetoglobus multicellularis str. Araruama TaxID=890399 RepID=A0A1V1PHJ2_9BACT|nr:MAG: PglZ domain protein [Candidatus Magnetoglobus multicellularis str. Araruama]
MAQQVEANLTQEECSHNSDELGHLDTFCFEADIFLKDAMTLLEESKWPDALKLAKSRLPDIKKRNISNSFWLKQDRKRLWLWEWIKIAAILGMKAAQIINEVKKQNPKNLTHEKLINLYTDYWWHLDQIHRKFSSLSERYQSTHSDLHIKAFIETRKRLHSLYRSCIDEQSLLWNQLCQLTGFLPAESLQQRYFFQNRLKPLIHQAKKTAVFFVDALRYELGQELVQELQSIFTQLDISVMLAELPTITAVGMNALVPVVKDGNMSTIFDKKGTISGFQGGERQVINHDNRHKTLQDHAGVETSWIKLNDLLSFTEKKLKKYFNQELLVVTAQDIDKMGESGALSYGINYFEKGITRLKTAILKVTEKGYEQFIITSDHGFILGDESLETGRAPKMECAERRYAYGAEKNSENFTSVSLNQLNYTNTEKENFFIFERTTHLLTNQSQTSFYHGGNTLQERLVPVISLSLAKNQPDHSGEFKLMIEKKSEDQGFHRIGVFPKSINPGLFAPSSLEVQLLSDADIFVEIGDIVGAERKGDILTLPLEQESEIYFKLRYGSISKAHIKFKTTQKKCKDYKVRMFRLF